MTKLLIILIAAISIFQTKPPVERHFLVGYMVNNNYGGAQVHTNGLVPIKKDIYKSLKKNRPEIEFKFSELVILSVSEFKNKKDCDYFFKYLWAKDTTHLHNFDLCLYCNQPGCGCWCTEDDCKYFQEYTTGKIFPSKDSAIAYLKKQKIIK